jgi:hypothetical protein
MNEEIESIIKQIKDIDIWISEIDENDISKRTILEFYRYELQEKLDKLKYIDVVKKHKYLTSEDDVWYCMP